MLRYRSCLHSTFILLIVSHFVACYGPNQIDSQFLKFRICDTTNIIIDSRIAQGFPCIDSLLKGWIINKSSIFQRVTFKEFFASPKTKLFFSSKFFSSDTSAISYGAKIDSTGHFSDTIFLNKTLFTKGSREFLMAVLIHESLHAYITWACLSYASGRNGVDATYLRKHFHSGWLRLTVQPFPDNELEHILMSENFVGIMSRTLYHYTNPQSDIGLRNSIAQSLTWGGLIETPKGMNLADTCYVRQVDIWARNMDADSAQGVRWGKCNTTGIEFLHSLELQPLSK